jgi:hypothetical protein
MEDGKYMAESPDEEALVDGGVLLGLKYIGQTGEELSVQAADVSDREKKKKKKKREGECSTFFVYEI